MAASGSLVETGVATEQYFAVALRSFLWAGSPRVDDPSEHVQAPHALGVPDSGSLPGEDLPVAYPPVDDQDYLYQKAYCIRDDSAPDIPLPVGF